MSVVVYSAEACLDRWIDGEMQQRGVGSERASAISSEQAVRVCKEGGLCPGS